MGGLIVPFDSDCGQIVLSLVGFVLRFHQSLAFCRSVFKLLDVHQVSGFGGSDCPLVLGSLHRLSVGGLTLVVFVFHDRPSDGSSDGNSSSVFFAEGSRGMDDFLPEAVNGFGFGAEDSHGYYLGE